MPPPMLPSATWLSEAFGEPDRDLLARFAAGGEAAFAELVRRHGPMVLGVCERVLGNRDDAEDAYQSTFLELAKRAGRGDWRESLAGWLHDVAWRTANKLRAKAARRRACEKQAGQLESVAKDNLPEALDEEVRRLPEAEREAVLCCYFQGLTRRQAAAKIGVSPRTLDRRLREGKRRLRERLEARGETVPVLLTGSAYSLTSYLGRWWLVAGLALVSGTLLAAWPHAEAPPDQHPPMAEKAAPPEQAPLPRHAIARLGETRFRHGEIKALAYSPDGKILATAGSGNGRGVCLWEATTGKLFRQFGEEVRWSESLAFSPDGKHLAVAVGWSVRLLDVGKGVIARELEGHTNGVEHVAWSDDGRWIASTSRDRTIRIWDAKAGRVAHVLKSKKRGSERVVFAPGSKLLAVPDGEEGLRLLDPATGRERHHFKDKAGVWHVAFSPDGAQVAWCGGGGEVRVWRTGGKSPPRVQFKGDGYCWNVTFNPDGRTLASCWSDANIRLLDPDTGRVVRRWTYHLRQPDSLTYSPDGKTLAAGGRETSAPLRWDPAKGVEIDPEDSHTGGVERLYFPPGGKTLLSVGTDNKVIRWDLATRSPKALRLPYRRWGGYTTFSPDGKLVAVGAIDDRPGRLMVHEVATGRLIRAFEQKKASIVSSAFANGGRRLATTEVALDEKARPEDARAVTLQVWDIAEGKQVCQAHDRQFNQRMRSATYLLKFTPDDRRILSATFDRVIRVFDADTGKLLRQHKLTGEAVSVDLSPDGKLAAIGLTEDISMILWDTTTGKVVRTWEANQAGQAAAWGAFSPDSRVLATTGEYPKGAVRLWDVATGQELASFRGDSNVIFHAAFSRDGRTIATDFGDSTIVLWDATGRAGMTNPALTPKKLHELWHTLADQDAKKAHAAVWEMALSPDGAVPFLRARLAPVKAADADTVDRLVKRLGGDEFASRESAAKELVNLAGAAIPRLRQVLEGKPELETRRRVEAILAAYHRGDDWRRQQQALTVLERGGSAAAWKLMGELAAGADGAPLTEEARSAQGRGMR